VGRRRQAAALQGAFGTSFFKAAKNLHWFVFKETNADASLSTTARFFNSL